ncbi:MAG: HEAT repeat domain-containing protein [Deltaproteobacteria bacterium]|nr:HEAT repeat domain-containing protein [Deltaproteobacteria bacterium]
MSCDLADRERESITAGLASRDAELRRLAVERILALPIRDAISGMIASLGDSSWRVRKASVGRLAACGEIELAADALIAALADGDNPGRRNSAVEALVSIGRPVLPKLIETLNSRDVDVRKLVVDAIAGIGDELGRLAMIESLGDCDPNVRAAAAEALGAIGGEGAEAALLACATDEGNEQLVRLSSLHSLISLDASVSVAELRGVLEDPVLAGAAYGLLGNLDDEESCACLLKGLGDPSRANSESAMNALLRVLFRRDGAEFDSLSEQIRESALSLPNLVANTMDRLPDADLSTRLAMVQFLGLVGEPECVIAILEAGRDEAISEVALSTLAQLGEVSELSIDRAWEQLDSVMRRDACRLLGSTAGPRAIERLLGALDSPEGEQRSAAAEALATCGFAGALVPLVRRLELAADDDELEAEEEFVVLVDAIVTLCSSSSGDESSLVADAVALISDRLDEANERTRLGLARVLGRIGRSEDAELVAPLMKDASADVRRVAVEALARLSAETSAISLRLALADESHLVRIAAARALAASAHENARDDLERLVYDEDWRVRAATLRTIGAHQRVGLTEDEKLDLIASRLGDEGAVCVAAVEALTQIGGAGSARVSASLLSRPEPELVQVAVSCIGLHGAEEDLLDLLPMVSHANWAVRAEAIQVLADRRMTRALPSILRRLEIEQDDFVRDVILRGLIRLEV